MKILQLIKRYEDFSSKLYSLLRFLMCPFNKMERFIPKKGIINDIGCGEGIFSIYLALESPERRIIGIDLNQKRINKAKQAAKGLPNLSFKSKNAVDLDTKVDGVVISDVFHHFPISDQEKFLKSSYKRLNNGGVLLIKEINKDDKIRANLSRFWDFIFYPKDKINYWGLDKFSMKLTGLGFKVSTFNEALYFPGSTILFLCQKK